MLKKYSTAHTSSSNIKQKFYVVGQRIVSAFVEADTSFSGPAHSVSFRVLNQTRLHRQFRVQKDGKRLKSISIDREKLFSNLIIKRYWTISSF